MSRLLAPNGAEIVGTKELVPGVALIQDVKAKPDGGFTFEFAGDTEMDWDGQTTVCKNVGKNGAPVRVFVDDQGDEWLETDLSVDEGDDGDDE
jgi:hypothetical protein